MAATKSTRPVEIGVVTRTYSGQEGERVHAGTKFAIGSDRPGFKTISKARYDQLAAVKLIRPLGEEDTAAAPARAGYAAGPTEAEKVGSVTTARSIRQSTRRRAKQPENPAAPKPLNAQAGSQTGAEKPSQSSPEGQASSSSTSGSRGNRRGAAKPPASSPSTTR